MSEFDFSPEHDGSLSIDSAVFQALGAASMCWGETPKGVFDSTRAKAIGDRLLEFIAASETNGAMSEVLERVRARCPACAAGYDSGAGLFYLDKRTPEGPTA